MANDLGGLYAISRHAVGGCICDLWVKIRTITGETVRHLSYGWRIIAIYLRAAIATSGFLLFEFARSFVNVIDNSVLHGADALIYALLYGKWLDANRKGKKAYTTWEWLGMSISMLSVLIVFVYELYTVNLLTSVEGVASGLISSVALATIILISSIIIYHDSVIRISFHNCLFGFAITTILVLSILAFNTNYVNSYEIMNIFHSLNFKSSASAGIAYAIALLCFLQAYKYIEPVFIAMLGNSLGLGTIFISRFFLNNPLDYKDIAITLLLLIGSVILGIQEWRKGRNEEKV